MVQWHISKCSIGVINHVYRKICINIKTTCRIFSFTYYLVTLRQICGCYCKYAFQLPSAVLWNGPTSPVLLLTSTHVFVRKIPRRNSNWPSVIISGFQKIHQCFNRSNNLGVKSKQRTNFAALIFRESKFSEVTKCFKSFFRTKEALIAKCVTLVLPAGM